MKNLWKLNCAVMCSMLALCSCEKSSTPESPTATNETFSSWHDSKRDVEYRIDQLMNAAGGPDYAAIIEIYEKSDWPTSVIDLRVGATIVSSFNDERKTKFLPQSLSQGFERMEKSALSRGESSIVTPHFLRLWFERGVGKAPNYVMAPIPEVAACWMKVEKDSYDDKIDDPAQVTTCIALRKKFMTKS
jgi:hypothetical protein